jgi:hypothetical protein
LAAEKPIRRGIIRNSTRALGLEHKEEAVWRIGANQIGFRTETYGDSDALEMELSNLATCRLRIHGTIDGYVKVGDPLKGNPFVHCPAFDWEVSGAQLIAAERLTLPLGGADLALDLELISDTIMPRDVSGPDSSGVTERRAWFPSCVLPRPPDRRLQGPYLAAVHNLHLSCSHRSSSSAQVCQPVDRPLRCGILSRLMTATDHTRNPPRTVACQLSPTADNVLAKTM